MKVDAVAWAQRNMAACTADMVRRAKAAGVKVIEVTR
jgi:hypothetical protein